MIFLLLNTVLKGSGLFLGAQRFALRLKWGITGATPP
jgi:hypothetical protein